MESAEVLVGYDARIVWAEREPVDSQKNDDDPRVYLQCAEPYSVYQWIWPSVFDRGLGYAMSWEQRYRAHQRDIKPPQWTGPVGRTWESLDSLQLTLAENRVAEREPYYLIAICAFDEAGIEGRTWYFEPEFPLNISPPAREPAWELLGYDVADASLESMLNIAWRKVEQTSWGDTLPWRDTLNAHHLFTDIEVAFAYRDFWEEKRLPTDEMVDVFGLYLIA